MCARVYEYECMNERVYAYVYHMHIHMNQTTKSWLCVYVCACLFVPNGIIAESQNKEIHTHIHSNMTHWFNEFCTTTHEAEEQRAWMFVRIALQTCRCIYDETTCHIDMTMRWIKYDLYLIHHAHRTPHFEWLELFRFFWKKIEYKFEWKWKLHIAMDTIEKAKLIFFLI